MVFEVAEFGRYRGIDHVLVPNSRAGVGGQGSGVGEEKECKG